MVHLKKSKKIFSDSFRCRLDGFDYANEPKGGEFDEIKFKKFFFFYLAITSALVKSAESFALDGRHFVPVVVPVAQVDPGLSAADVSGQQVPPSGFEADAARSVVRWSQNPAVRERHASFIGHLICIFVNLI